VQAATLALTALITSAVHDANPRVDLAEIYHKVSSLNGRQYLVSLFPRSSTTIRLTRQQDSLHTLPSLLDTSNSKAQDLIGIITECGSAKETLISAQECLERLVRRWKSDEFEDEKEHGRAPVDVFVAILDVYASGERHLGLFEAILMRNSGATSEAAPEVCT